MEKFLGLFPLNLVAFPGERLNLHIFEPRYKQLINDCIESKSTFGIPSYVMNKIDYGTEMRITEVFKVYPDGRMDICTEGISTFRVIDFEQLIEGKLYSSGTVRMMPFDNREDKELKLRLIDLLKQLFSWLKVEEEMVVDKYTKLTDVVHKVGLKKEEEYELLTLESESARMMFLSSHIKKLLPALERVEKAKEVIRMNGHFKHLDPLNL